jgi:hypothetical protein
MARRRHSKRVSIIRGRRGGFSKRVSVRKGRRRKR